MYTDLDQLPSALAEFEKIQQHLSGKQLAIFLDYDGTLTPIVAHPEEARLHSSMRQILQQLASKYAVAIISGRDLQDIKQLVGIENIYYAGSHGFDTAGPKGLKCELPDADQALPLLQNAEQDIQKAVKGIEGAQVERKKFSLAIHYRNVKSSEKSAVKNKLEKLCSTYKGLKLVHGKEVFDLRPDVDWHKGKALLWLKERMSLEKPIFSFYLGDDTTDEDAFEVLGDEGIGIAVCCELQKTHASYQLKDTQEVEKFLKKILAL